LAAYQFIQAEPASRVGSIQALGGPDANPIGIRVNDKERFFTLGIRDRRRIGYLVPIISVVHIIQFAVAPPSTVLSRWGGIVLNALGAFWSVRPENAPRFWFGLLPYVWWIGAIFDGMEVFRALKQGSEATLASLLAGLNLLLLPFLAMPLLRFHKASFS